MIKWRAFKSRGVIFGLLVFVASISCGLYYQRDLWWFRYDEEYSYCITCGIPTTNKQTVQYSQLDPSKSVWIRFDDVEMKSQGQQVLKKSIPLWLCDGCKPPETIRNYENHHQINGVLSHKPPAMDFGVIFLAIAALAYLIIEYRNY